MTILQSLKSLTAYPIPLETIENIAEECGCTATDEANREVRGNHTYKRAKAHVYVYLSAAPNISQNGIGFNFSSEERKRFKAMATQLLAEIGEDTSIITGKRYGYVGENL